MEYHTERSGIQRLVYESKTSSVYSASDKTLEQAIPRSTSIMAAASAEQVARANADSPTWPIQHTTSSESVQSAESSRIGPLLPGANVTRIPIRRGSGTPLPPALLGLPGPHAQTPVSSRAVSAASMRIDEHAAALYDEDGFLIADEPDAALNHPMPQSGVYAARREEEGRLSPQQIYPRYLPTRSNRSGQRYVTEPVAMLSHSHSVPLELLHSTGSTSASTAQSFAKREFRAAPASSSSAQRVRRSRSMDKSTRHPSNSHRTVQETSQDRQRRLHAINTAPQGPPPWLSKYQPDPSIPIDEQLLPTVAKKLATEQAMREADQGVILNDLREPIYSQQQQTFQQASRDDVSRTAVASELPLPILETVSTARASLQEPAMVRPDPNILARSTTVRNFSRRAIVPSPIVASSTPAPSHAAMSPPDPVPATLIQNASDEPLEQKQTSVRSSGSHAQEPAQASEVPERTKSGGCCTVM